MILRKFMLRAALLGTIVLARIATAQTAGNADEVFFDTVEVNVVNVEVIVTDKDGVPITGLGPEDFEISEDGEPVTLSNFFAVESGQTVRAQSDATSRAETLSGPETQHLNLIVYVDDLNLLPQNRKPVLDNLRKYLERSFDPKDRVMLARFNGEVEIAQPFTNDPSLLVAAIDKIAVELGRGVVLASDRNRIISGIENTILATPNPLDPGLFETSVLKAESLAKEIRYYSEASLQRTRAALHALNAFTDSLAGLRGRKAVLYVSDGMSLRPSDSLVLAWLNHFEAWALEHNRGRIVRDLTSLNTREFDSSRDFEQLVADASANRVAFYPLSNAQGFTSRVSAQASGAAVSALGAQSIDAGGFEAASSEDALLMMADGTGGLAFTRSANIGGLLERMGRDFESFYSLGYSPARKQDANFHTVKVKVRRDGAKVRHLKGYRQRDPLESLQDLALSAASNGIEDNALGVRLTPGEQIKTKADRYQVQVMVQIPFEKLLLLPEAEVHSGRLTVYVVVRDLERSGMSSPQRIELPIQIPNERILEALGQALAYPLQLDMEKGRKRVSLAVRDNLARIDATVSVELEVGGAGG